MENDLEGVHQTGEVLQTGIVLSEGFLNLRVVVSLERDGMV